MKRTAIILFTLTLGFSLAGPTAAAAGSWDLPCTNPLSTCASVSISLSGGNVVTMTVTNLSSDILTGIGLSGSGFVAFPFTPPTGWTMTRSGNFSGFFLGAAADGSGNGIGNGGAVSFQFSFYGTFTPEQLAFTSGFEPTGEVLGVEPLTEPSGTTVTTPEPTSLLLLGTGLAGVAAIRRRRREELEEED